MAMHAPLGIKWLPYHEERVTNAVEHILNKSDFIKLVEGEDIDYGFKFVNLFFFKSNLIFIAKKFKS